MGDTQNIIAVEGWQEFFTTEEVFFTFNNLGPALTYVVEKVGQPAKNDRGYTFRPGEGGGGFRKTGEGTFWVRTLKTSPDLGKARFYFGIAETT